MNGRLLLRALAAAIVIAAAAPRTASAQASDATVSQAKDHFTRGDTAYNLGRYDDAIEWFTKAYETWPQPEFLYNIAQSHRQAGNCKQALRFYKRFKSLKEKDKKAPLGKRKKAEVDRFIEELTGCAEQADTSATTPPDTIDPPPGGNGAAGAGTSSPGPSTAAPTGAVTQAENGSVEKSSSEKTVATTAPEVAASPEPAVESEDDDDEPAAEVATVDELATARPHIIAIRAAAGVAKVVADPLSIELQPTVALGLGYPLSAGALLLDLGVGVTYSPLPYETMESSETGRLLGARATIGATVPVTSRIGLRGDLGVGVVALGGLVDGNPFTDTREAGSFTMLSVRTGVAADFLITPSVVATLAPISVAYSPAPEELYMTAITEISVLAGIAYRM